MSDSVLRKREIILAPHAEMYGCATVTLLQMVQASAPMKAKNGASDTSHGQQGRVSGSPEVIPFPKCC